MTRHREIARRTGLAALAIACAFGAWPLARPSAQTPAPAPIAGSTTPAVAMSGAWDYNDDLSVDAATGRPEQAPLSATQRRRGGGPPATGGGAGSGGAAGGGVAGGGAGGVGGGSMDDFDRSMQAMFIAERRALVRDLLEVPEMLRIRVTSEGVTFVDDLKRERTYPSDGKLRKYQLGAAQFEARASWDGARFRKDIEGPNTFRMSEVYFLAEDGNRLIVVVRIGDPRKPEAQFGVNRVYDRVQ